MPVLVAPQSTADIGDYYEVRDLLSGENIGRISGRRLRENGGLRRALEKHGFRLVALRGERKGDLPVLADAA